MENCILFVAPTECKMPPRGGIQLWTQHLSHAPYMYMPVNIKSHVTNDQAEWTGSYRWTGWLWVLTGPFRGINRISLLFQWSDRKMATCNRSVLETFVCQPIMPQKPSHALLIITSAWCRLTLGRASHGYILRIRMNERTLLNNVMGARQHIYIKTTKQTSNKRWLLIHRMFHMWFNLITG